MLDQQRLRVLATFAELGTVTATAGALHMSQSTVSHHLQRLQVESGAVLLTRIGRSLQLTAEGRLAAQRGANVLADIDRLERDLRAMTDLAAGTVRLVAFPSAVPTMLPPLLERLARGASGLRLELIDAEPPEAADLLRSGQGDVAVSFRYPDDEPEGDLTVIDIGVDPLHLVTRREVGDQTPALAPAQAPIELEALAAYEQAQWLAGCPRCRTHLVSVCRDLGFVPTLGYTSDDYVAVQSLVAAGLGVTMLPGLALWAFHHPGVSASPVASRARIIQASTRGQPPHTPAIAFVLTNLRQLGHQLLGGPQVPLAKSATPSRRGPAGDAQPVMPSR